MPRFSAGVLFLVFQVKQADHLDSYPKEIVYNGYCSVDVRRMIIDQIDSEKQLIYMA